MAKSPRPRRPRILTPATVEDRLSQELHACADTVHALSALSHSGKWPKTQMVAARDTAMKVARHALTIGEIIRGWR